MSRTLKLTVIRGVFAAVAVAAAATGIYFQRDAIHALLPEQRKEVAKLVEKPAQPVRVTRVTFSRPSALTVYTGTIRPRLEAAIGFRVAGKLLERLVSVGDKVKAGQTLARLDDTDARLDLESTEAELLAAQTELQRAKAEAERNRKLLAKGFASRAAFDRTAATQAEAQSRVDRASRARDLSTNRLKYMVLESDNDGVVTAELADAGLVLQAGQPVVSIAQMDALDVVFALPEQNLEKLQGAKATAQILEQKNENYALNLRDISPDVDPTTRTYRVRMGMVAPDSQATLGRTVSVAFAALVEKPIAALPLAAVLNDGSGASVWRLSPGNQKVQRVAVKIEAVDGLFAMVSEGLSEGDTVVSLGAYKIDPARTVKVVETTTSALN